MGRRAWLRGDLETEWEAKNEKGKGEMMPEAFMGKMPGSRKGFFGRPWGDWGGGGRSERGVRLPSE